MIDMPPEPPPSQERVIEQQMIDCGLNTDGFTVKYEDDLQSIEIAIAPQAGASQDKFDCIREAAGYEIVTFEDGSMQAAYMDFVGELYRPQMLEEATEKLRKRGLLDGLPLRSQFETADAYALALEAHCGVEPGSALKVSGESIMFQPDFDEDFNSFHRKYSNLLTAIKFAVASGDFANIGFIGNEAYANDKAPE